MLSTYLKVEFAEPKGSLCSALVGTTKHFFQELCQFIIPPAVYVSSNSPLSLPKVSIFYLFHFHHSGDISLHFYFCSIYTKYSTTGMKDKKWIQKKRIEGALWRLHEKHEGHGHVISHWTACSLSNARGTHFTAQSLSPQHHGVFKLNFCNRIDHIIKTICKG